MALYLLYTIFILACFVLVLAILLQPGKADAGALFTSSISSTAFGPRGTQTLLAKITIVAAAVFMLAALLISMGVGGYRSVVTQGGGETPAATPQATPAAQQEQVAPPESAPAQTENPAPPTNSASPGTAASPAATQ